MQWPLQLMKCTYSIACITFFLFSAKSEVKMHFISIMKEKRKQGVEKCARITATFLTSTDRTLRLHRQHYEIKPKKTKISKLGIIHSYVLPAVNADGKTDIKTLSVRFIDTIKICTQNQSEFINR